MVWLFGSGSLLDKRWMILTWLINSFSNLIKIKKNKIRVGTIITFICDEKLICFTVEIEIFHVHEIVWQNGQQI